jgi:hypothetical protein
MKALFSLFIAISLQAASIELEWNVESDKDVKEYSLTYGTDSGVVTTMKIGKVKSYVVKDLNENRSYWFEITPISYNDVYGKKSNTINYTVPTKKVNVLEVKPKLKIKRK